jgi:hypothetical protein
MRFSDMRGFQQERDTLLGKKRLGKNQKARLRDLSTILDPRECLQPPATPPRPVTGLVDGRSQGDFQGNVYAMHSGNAPTLRRARRAQRFGLGGIRPLRSRIQRGRRKTRTGGVK